MANKNPYRIKPNERGHRRQTFPGEKMSRTSVYLPTRLVPKLQRIGNKRLAQWVEEHEDETLQQCKQS